MPWPTDSPSPNRLHPTAWCQILINQSPNALAAICCQNTFHSTDPRSGRLAEINCPKRKPWLYVAVMTTQYKHSSIGRRLHKVHVSFIKLAST